jgi:hypothetical protein
MESMWMFLLLLVAAPFWQEQPVAQWNDIQLAQFVNDSPWAHAATGSGKVQGPAVQTYLATGHLVEQAVAERARRAALRRKSTEEDALAEEYRAWFEDNRASQVILAIRVGNPPGFSEEAEIRKMQENSAMRSGKGKVKMSSYFPPTANDPYVHMAFPREMVSEGEKFLDFELYLPGISGPFRTVEFVIQDLKVDGKEDY